MLLGLMGKSGGRATLKPVGHQVEDDWLAGNFFNTGPTSKILPCNTFLRIWLEQLQRRPPPTPYLLTVGGTQSTRVGLMYSSCSSPTAYQPLSFFYINWNTQGFPFYFLKKKPFFFLNWRKIALQMLCWFMPYNKMNQSQLYIYICIFICVCVSCSVVSDSLWPL